MKLITLYVPEPKLKALDQLVTENFYPNRAEAIRIAINDLLINHDALPFVPFIVTEPKISEASLKDIQRPPEELVCHYKRRIHKP